MSELSDKEFCELYNSYTGEGGIFSGIDNTKQLTVHMTGEELKEWTEFALKQANGQPDNHEQALPICDVVQQSELLIGLLTMLEKEGGNKFINKAEIVAKYQANL